MTTVLVTGGARGVGLGIVRCFLDAGFDVVTCSRHEPTADLGRAEFVRADVRDLSQVDALVTSVVDRYGTLDVVVNNAGGAPPVDAATASPRLHAKIIELNLVAPLHVSQRANTVMQRQETGGVILMIGSVSGTRPSPGTAAYGAAKAGLANLAASLAVEWAPKVRVNTVVAGPVDTEQSHLHYGDAAGVAAVGATIPLGRMAVPSDVGQACRWLASPAAAYVSGSTVTVHGGGERPAFLAAADPS
ncbi:SDR family oxidoreductase [Actinophytocola glycyrrhizae]|uniref:SDR family oxidoreductase n=1 Tax=Actinophytocola glycyrrhizae TaxID=2044873 RepID=A0ABV9S1V6_9PSEU